MAEDSKGSSARAAGGLVPSRFLDSNTAFGRGKTCKEFIVFFVAVCRRELWLKSLVFIEMLLPEEFGDLDAAVRKTSRPIERKGLGS